MPCLPYRRRSDVRATTSEEHDMARIRRFSSRVDAEMAASMLRQRHRRPGHERRLRRHAPEPRLRARHQRGDRPRRPARGGHRAARPRPSAAASWVARWRRATGRRSAVLTVAAAGDAGRGAAGRAARPGRAVLGAGHPLVLSPRSGQLSPASATSATKSALVPAASSRWSRRGTLLGRQLRRAHAAARPPPRAVGREQPLLATGARSR
jgi:hypothetical protein